MVPMDAAALTHVIPGKTTFYLFNFVTGIKAPGKLEATGDSSAGFPPDQAEHNAGKASPTQFVQSWCAMTAEPPPPVIALEPQRS